MVFKNKRGNAIFDSITFMILIFVFVIITTVALFISQDITTSLVAEDDISQIAKDNLQESNNRYPSYFDSLIVFVIFALWVALIVSSFMINTHPIFFIATFIVAIFVVFLGLIFANTLEEITTDPDFSTYAEQLPMTAWLSIQYPYVALAMMFSVILVLFGKELL